jgi:hypothetical protein
MAGVRARHNRRWDTSGRRLSVAGIVVTFSALEDRALSLLLMTAADRILG